MPNKAKQGKTVGVLTLLLAVAVVLFQRVSSDTIEAGVDAQAQTPIGSQASPGTVAEQELGEEQIREAYQAQRSDLQVEVQARVARLLADDLDGDRHQRFILEFARSEHTVLISHNIDLAPRVPLSEGDWVRVVGEYEWSERGGVIHWTHHNPARNPIHPPGWIDHEGVRYE